MPRKGEYKQYSEEIINGIIDDYNNGKSIDYIKAAYHIGGERAKEFIKNAGILLGSRADRYRKYRWNENFFAKDTSITAYWAGFAYADGCLKETSQNRNSLIFDLHSKDTEHLKLFCSHISLDNAEDVLKLRSKWVENDNIKLAIYSRRLPETLSRWGVVPRKTYNWQEPDIPKDLIPHFVRGWIDGDGHIGKHQKVISIASHGTMPLLWICRQFPDCNYEFRDINYEKSKAWVLDIRRDSVYPFLKFIDWQNPLRLERKYSHIDPTGEHWRNDFTKRVMTSEQAKALQNGKNWTLF